MSRYKTWALFHRKLTYGPIAGLSSAGQDVIQVVARRCY